MFRNFSYKAFSVQKLQNVSIIRPSLFWVSHGETFVTTKNEKFHVNHSKLLIINTTTPMKFHNFPKSNVFTSKQVSFSCAPNKESLILSEKNNKEKSDSKLIEIEEELLQILNAIHSLNTNIISKKNHDLFVNILYTKLADIGLLHILFPTKEIDLVKKLMLFLSEQPDFKHNINNICSIFGLSKSTLIRKLKIQNTTFKLLLRSIRMNHALLLIQRGSRDIDLLALSCGYQSSIHFKSYFEEQFNQTVKEYISTLDLTKNN